MASAAEGNLGTALYLAGEIKGAEELKHDCTLIGTEGTAGDADNQLDKPCGIAIDSKGRIVVADTNNHRVLVFRDDGSLICKIGSGGSREGEFKLPSSIAINKSSGRMYVADSYNHRVQVLELEEEPGRGLRFVSEFGSSGSGAGEMRYPCSIAVSQRDGSVFVVQSGNNRVQVFTGDGNHVRMIGADNLYLISHVALDEDDNVYVTDYGSHQVLVFSSKDDSLLFKIGSEGSADGQFTEPQSICADEHRSHIVVGDINGIQVFNKEDGSFVCKLRDKTFQTAGVCVDSEGRIYASNFENHTIERWA